MSYSAECTMRCNPLTALGRQCLGNAIRNSRIDLYGPTYTFNQPAQPIALGDQTQNYWVCYPTFDGDVGRGNIYENVTVAGLERSIKAGNTPNSLFRNNRISVAASASGMDYNVVDPDELVLARANSRASLSGNSYSAAASARRYAAEEGADVPRLVLPYRVLRLRGPQGSTLTGNIPVYNAGIKTSSWSASAPAWLGVTAANRTLTAEVNDRPAHSRGKHLGANARHPRWQDPSSDGTRGTDRHRSSRRRVTVPAPSKWAAKDRRRK